VRLELIITYFCHYIYSLVLGYVSGLLIIIDSAGAIFVQLLKPVEAKVHKSAIGGIANRFEQKTAGDTNVR
jgi:hypothetical protein